MMKFIKPFRGVPNGAVYPIGFLPGDVCPPELEAAASASDALEATTSRADGTAAGGLAPDPELARHVEDLRERVDGLISTLDGRVAELVSLVENHLAARIELGTGPIFEAIRRSFSLPVQSTAAGTPLQGPGDLSTRVDTVSSQLQDGNSMLTDQLKREATQRTAADGALDGDGGSVGSGDEEHPLGSLTVVEIKQKLDASGIAYKASASKADLLALLPAE